MNYYKKEPSVDNIYVMSSSRIVRGTKARIFLYVCVVLIVVGVLACYKNTLSQLDNVKVSSDICHKQEEHLATQLQVITDYKQRLEKSLKTEKAEHQRTKNELENKINEEKSNNEKNQNENKIRYSSLKQQYNLLKTQHDDFQEECSRVKKIQLDEMNDVQAKLKEIQEEVKKERNAKESLKTQYLQVVSELETLKKQFKGDADVKAADDSKINHLTKVNYELTKQIEEYKEKCHIDVDNAPADVGGLPVLQPPSSLLKAVPSPSVAGTKESKPAENSNNNNNVGEQPPAQQAQEKGVLMLPNTNKSGTSSTASSNAKVSKASLNAARPLRVPTLTPSTSKKPYLNENMPNMVLPAPYRRLPEGVVPVPMGQVAPEESHNDNNIIDNRYSNKIEEVKGEPKPKLEDGDKENGANEEFDGAGFENEPIDGMVFDGKKDPIKEAEKLNFKKQHIDALGLANHKEANREYEAQAEHKEYKDNGNDVQLEENDPEEDDDADDYGGDQHQKEPAVRN